MLNKSSLLLGITSFVISLYAGEFDSLIADTSASPQVTLIISSDPTTILTVSPIFNHILITNPQEITEGFVSHNANLTARSLHHGGYYVDVHIADSMYLGSKSSLGTTPGECFTMVRDHDPSYGIEFELLSDKAPNGDPTPIHHEGFGPAQGGTSHMNKSKIINTEGQPHIDMQVYGMHFFIFTGQFKRVPHGFYISRLVVNLIET